MTVLTLVLGVMIVAQFRAGGRVRAAASTRDEQVLLLSEVADANLGLRTEIEALRAQEEASAGSEGVVGLEQLVAELNRIKVFNGMVEVSGPGVELVLDGPLNALDLQDAINELRNAGAEAASLNGHRLVVNSTVIVNDKGAIVLDGQVIRRPYRFLAVGDPETLRTAVLRSGGLVELLRRSYPSLGVDTVEHSRVVLGVHRPALGFQFAQPVE